MKKVNLMLACAAVAVAGVFSSCSSDDTNPAPSITASLNGKVQDAVAVASGSTVSFDFNIVVPAEVESITLTTTVGTDATTKTLTKSEYTVTNDTLVTVSGTIAITAATTLKLTVLDKDDQESSKTVTITVTDPEANFSSYSAVLLNDAVADGSSATFFDSKTGKALKIAEASTADFGYLYDQDYVKITGACLISAKQYALSKNYTTTALANETSFKKASGVAFADLKVSTIASAYTNGTAPTTVTGYPAGTIIPVLAANDIYAFKTAAGKYGVLKVISVSATSISIDVKVQN
jgi:hypothetical protein